MKTENLTVEKIRHYDILLVEPSESERYSLTHQVVETFDVFAGLDISISVPFVRIKKREAIYLMKSKKLKKNIEVKGF